jgi:hypothetical protein
LVDPARYSRAQRISMFQATTYGDRAFSRDLIRKYTLVQRIRKAFFAYRQFRREACRG